MVIAFLIFRVLSGTSVENKEEFSLSFGFQGMPAIVFLGGNNQLELIQS